VDRAFGRLGRLALGGADRRSVRVIPKLRVVLVEVLRRRLDLIDHRRPPFGWKGAVDGLKKTGALGSSKRWSSVIDEIKATTEDLDKYDSQLRKHTYAATIGTAKRESAKPAECPVHSYNTSLSTLRRASATFGKAPLVKPPATAGPAVHSYSAMGSSLTPKSGGATFGRASTGRGEPPRTACSVASYSAPASTLRPRGGGTFGKAAARPGSVAMTRTGLLLSAKPNSLPPLEPLLQGKKGAATAANALGFASKLKRAVASAESVGAAAAPLEPLPPRATSADVLILDSGDGPASPFDATPTGGATPTLASGEATPMLASGEATPAELEDTEEEGTVRTSGAAALALELLKEESASPVKRKLNVIGATPLALDQTA